MGVGCSVGFNVGDVEGFIEGISVDKRCEIIRLVRLTPLYKHAQSTESKLRLFLQPTNWERCV